MRYLLFDLSEGDDGISTLEAMATTSTLEKHNEALAEAEQVVAWAHQHFPGRHGPVEEGHAWDHELLVQHETGEWITVTLTLGASAEFVAAFLAAFSEAD
jgi:hypothetical protein